MIPTFNQLYTNILGNVQSFLGIINIISKKVVAAFSSVQTATIKLIYIALDKVNNNITPEDCDEPTLLRYGTLWLRRTPFAATDTQLEITVTGTIGGIIPPGQTLKTTINSTNTQKIFIFDAGVTLTATSQQISVRSLEIGTDTKQEVGDELQFTSPIINVDNLAVVFSVTQYPTAAENIEDYRAKVIEKMGIGSNSDSGGSYRLRSQDVAGVRTSYPYPVSGQVASVIMYVEAEVASSTDGYGTPSATMLTAVENSIDLDPDITKTTPQRKRRSITLYDLTVSAINLLNVDVEITDLSSSLLTTQIEAAITNYLYNIRPFVDSCDDISNINKGRLFSANLFTVIKNAIGDGETFTSIIVEVNSVAITDYTFEDGYIPKFNTLTLV